MNIYYEKNRDQMPVDCWTSVDNICDAHFHSSVELMYVVSGVVKANCGSQTLLIRAGSALISPSYTLHDFATIKHSNSIHLTIPLDIIPSYKSIMKNNRFTENIYADNDGRLLSMLNQINVLCAKKSNNTLLYKGLVYAVLGLLLEKLPIEPYSDKKTRDFSKDVLIYLQENFADLDITLDSVAANFGYSKSRFSHIFTNTFGYTFHQYLIMLRCRNAAARLVNEGDTLMDAALSSGFENMRTFYRAFKNSFGVTPSEFIKGNSSIIT